MPQVIFSNLHKKSIGSHNLVMLINVRIKKPLSLMTSGSSWLRECATLFTYDIIWLYKKRIEIFILYVYFTNFTFQHIIKLSKGF